MKSSTNNGSVLQELRRSRTRFIFTIIIYLNWYFPVLKKVTAILCINIAYSHTSF